MSDIRPCQDVRTEWIMSIQRMDISILINLLPTKVVHVLIYPVFCGYVMKNRILLTKWFCLTLLWCVILKLKASWTQIMKNTCAIVMSLFTITWYENTESVHLKVRKNSLKEGFWRLKRAAFVSWNKCFYKIKEALLSYERGSLVFVSIFLSSFFCKFG